MADNKTNRHLKDFKDLIGYRFGRLIVVSPEAPSECRPARWICACDCGVTTILALRNLTRKDKPTLSCGCYQREITSARSTSHGMRESHEYETWCSAKKRCLNPSSAQYKNYGARGITMCEEWRNSFERFYSDMGPRPPGMEIDRIDNDGNYEKNNCHWTDRKTNTRNRRNAVRVTYNGETLPLKEWAERTGIKYGTLWMRRKSGWPLFAPVS